MYICDYQFIMLRLLLAILYLLFSVFTIPMISIQFGRPGSSLHRTPSSLYKNFTTCIGIITHDPLCCLAPRIPLVQRSGAMLGTHGELQENVRPIEVRKARTVNVNSIKRSRMTAMPNLIPQCRQVCRDDNRFCRRRCCILLTLMHLLPTQRLFDGHRDTQKRALGVETLSQSNIVAGVAGLVVDYGSLHSISIGAFDPLGYGSVYQFEYTWASF